jgi:hypothetical protein
MSVKCSKQEKLLSPLDSARDDKGKLESKVMPETESQEMLFRKTLEAQFKNKIKLTFPFPFGSVK